MSLFGGSFRDLLLSLKGYEGPTLVLLKHIEKGAQGDPKNNAVYVFGGFSSTPWQEDANYHGNNESFVFSLIPKFRKYHAVPGTANPNFLYMNGKKTSDSKHKVGLGFGGMNFESFRIWIDEDIEKGSYTSAEDQTFEKGSLVDPLIKQLNVI